MNHLTNYYKNLSEQLQEKVNILNYKLRQLNEMRGPPGSAADDIAKYFELLLKQFKNGEVKTIEKLIEKLQTYIAQHAGAWDEDGVNVFRRTWDVMKNDEWLMRFFETKSGFIMIPKKGADGEMYFWCRTKTGRIFRMDKNGHIELIKQAKDSPYGRIVNGSPKVKPPKAVERPTVEGGGQNSPPRSPKDGGRVAPGQSTPEQVGDQ